MQKLSLLKGQQTKTKNEGKLQGSQNFKKKKEKKPTKINIADV
jgi:hypothetical protein